VCGSRGNTSSAVGSMLGKLGRARMEFQCSRITHTRGPQNMQFLFPPNQHVYRDIGCCLGPRQHFPTLVRLIVKGGRWHTSRVYRAIGKPRGLLKVKVCNVAGSHVLVLKCWLKIRASLETPNNAFSVFVNVNSEPCVVR